MIEFKNFSFRYESGEEDNKLDYWTLKNINLTIHDGEFVLLTGRSGCGKTTLMRSLNGLIPHFYEGKTKGDLLLDGVSLLDMKPSELAGKIGTVFQDPRSQFFMTDTTRELAFGCENMGYDRDETVRRVTNSVTDLELEEYLNKSIFALSSGEKQQIAIGSVYALAPSVYIFDEPSANLDYDATKRLAQIMKRLKNAGVTVIVVEHRFYYLRDLLDTAVLVQDGKINLKFTRDEFCKLDETTRIKYGLRTVFPEEEVENFSSTQESAREGSMLSVSALSFSYDKSLKSKKKLKGNGALKNKKEVLSNICFKARNGDITGIIGHNGAGKTTLLSIMTGILSESSGEIKFNGKRLSTKQRRKISYLVMQDADYQLFGSSVEEELKLGLSDINEGKVLQTLDSLELSAYKERHPAALSGGQKQRVTIGAAIMKESPIIYFDEPTSGLDYDSMIRVSSLIKSLAKNGAIIFVVSHDFEFITRTCTKILRLDGSKELSNISVTRGALKQLAMEYFNKFNE